MSEVREMVLLVRDETGTIFMSICEDPVDIEIQEGEEMEISMDGEWTPWEEVPWEVMDGDEWDTLLQNY